MSYDSIVFILASYLVVRRPLNSGYLDPSYHVLDCEVKQNYKLQYNCHKVTCMRACAMRLIVNISLYCHDLLLTSFMRLLHLNSAGLTMLHLRGQSF